METRSAKIAPYSVPRVRSVIATLAAIVCCGFASNALAHPLAPSLLEMREESGGNFAVRFKTPSLRAPGVELEPVLPSHCEAIEDRSVTVEPNHIELHWRVACGAEGLLGAQLSVTGLERSRTTALIRVVLLDGSLMKGLVRADAPAFEVRGGDSVAGNYLFLGFEHILLGPDHLLFVLGLLLLIVGLRKLVGAITSFTIGHSLTLAAAMLDLIRIPQQIVEIGIAISLVMVAVELARRDVQAKSLLRSRPWMVSFGFGLLHGLGFAGALREAGLPVEEIPFALLFFNLGIEAGQLAFIAVAFGLIAWLQKKVVERSWIDLVSAYAIGSLAVYWVLERSANLL